MGGNTALAEQIAQTMSPQAIAAKESLLPPKRAWELRLGMGLEELLPASKHGAGDGSGDEESVYHAMQQLLKEHASDMYVLGGSVDGRVMHAVLKEGATDKTQLQAAFHAHYARQRVHEAEKQAGRHLTHANELAEAVIAAHADMLEHWPLFRALLLSSGWQPDDLMFLNPGSQRLGDAGAAASRQEGRTA